MWPFDTPAPRGQGWAVLAVLVSLPGACTTDDTGGTAAPSGSATARRPSSRTAGPPEGVAGCTGAEVHRLVHRFVQAFNAGDQPTLQRLWARSGRGFAWYSTDGPGRRINAVAEDRASLGGYFAERHARKETLRLTSFRFNSNQGAYGNFQYTLVRRAADLPPTGYAGKGAALCTSVPRTIGVWSMAKNPQASPAS